jgi:hypothetical protein
MTKELLKQALDVINKYANNKMGDDFGEIKDAKKAISAFLNAPEWPEPSGKVLTLADSLADLAGAERPAQLAPVPADTSDEGSRYDRLDAYMRRHCSNPEPYNFAKESAAPVPVPPGWKPMSWQAEASLTHGAMYGLRAQSEVDAYRRGLRDAERYHGIGIAASPEVP